MGATVICLAPLAHKWLKPIAVVGACCIAFSRLYLAVHNPTDVLLGALHGIVCGVVTVAITKEILAHLKVRMHAKRAS